MSRENREIVRTSLAVVIAACLLKVAVDGLGWDETTADTASEPTTADAAPAIKSCGDFQLRLPDVPGSLPIRVDVLEGNIPCRMAQRVMRDQYREIPTGSWSCRRVRLSVTQGIAICEKNRGGQGTIRGRLPCRYWGPLRSRCQDKFGPPWSGRTESGPTALEAAGLRELNGRLWAY
jgi:hypothetical protein